MILLADSMIDPGALLTGFCEHRTEAGAVVSFTGLTRGLTDGAAVTRLTLDAYPGFTEAVMAEIEAEARALFPVQDLLAVHRWGSLSVGAPIVFVAAGAAPRPAAFGAGGYQLAKFKHRGPP